MVRAQAEKTTTRRILVVDDDPETARVVTSWFEGEPFEVLTAADGREGLSRSLQERPDLILLDLKMPGVDGIHVARSLKDRAETRAIPVVLLTACRDTDHKVQAFAAGADDYITKPFDLEEMDARVRAMLRRRDFLANLESTIENLETTNSELERMAMLDEKTGLFNFREFRRKLTEEWSRAERYGNTLSLVLLDIDSFKALNDTLGHPAGDRALSEFATLVAGGARVTDMAARYGGEEFAVVLPHTDGKMAHRVAERIRAAVEEFVFLADETPSRITVSAGVASFPGSKGVDSVDALVAAADDALYDAKARGKNCTVTAPAAPEESRPDPARRRVYRRESSSGGRSSRTTPPPPNPAG